MALSLEFEDKISKEELLTQHMSDIKLEIEIIKVKAWQRNDQEILEHIEKIDNSLGSMMDTKLDLAEKYHRFELTI
jgi:hypothetical protein